MDTVKTIDSFIFVQSFAFMDSFPVYIFMLIYAAVHKECVW